MFKFRFFPDKDAYGRKERILRLMALALVFMLVLWAFSKNNQRIIERLENQQTITDTGGYLDDQQKSFIKGFRDGMRERYGLAFKLKIYKHGIENPPEADSKTVVLLLAPEPRELDLRLPPLLSSALGQEFLDQMKAEHLEKFWDHDPWQDELILLLASIWDRLEGMQIPKGTS